MRELAEWLEYWRVEPWGAEAEDIRHGNIAAAVRNANARRKSDLVGPEVFRVRFESCEEAEQNRREKVAREGKIVMGELMKRSLEANAEADADGR